MRFHTNTLTRGDFSAALRSAGLDGVWVNECYKHGSRKRARAYEVRLAAEPSRDKEGKARRPRMTGKYGAESSDYQKAATYNEHGWWMAELYKLDPELICDRCYYDVNSFHERTRYQFESAGVGA